MMAPPEATVLVLLFASLLAVQEPAGGAATARFDASLPTWLVGCWQGTRGDTRFEERWHLAGDATLLGVAHTTRDGRLRAFEFLRISSADGALLYIAQPGGGPATTFTATARTDRELRFENPAHDHPRRIVYERTGTDRVLAWIDGGPQSPGGRTEYPMTRGPCEE